MIWKCVERAELPQLRLLKRGKVRDIYQLNGQLAMIATDRISAYDKVLPTGIPARGVVLNKLSIFWFRKLQHVCQHHLVDEDDWLLPEPIARDEQLRLRTMLVKKLKPIPIECIARGYLAGSAWREYSESGAVCGIKLPPGLRQCERLPEPIFTPSTKEESGHDVNISIEEASGMVGRELAEKLAEITLRLYREASDHALSVGIILADAKLEFGLGPEGELVWMDEAFTPDSSRFWDASKYEPGRPQESMDKQFVRDWLAAQGWRGEGKPPSLPQEVVEKTQQIYLEVYRRLVGRSLESELAGGSDAEHG